MKKNHMSFVKRLAIVVVTVLGIVGIASMHQVDGSAVTESQNGFSQVVPVHTYAYKLGDTREVIESVKNNERIAKNLNALREEKLAKAEAERTAKEAAEKKEQDNKEVLHSKEASDKSQVVEEKAKVEKKAESPAKREVSTSVASAKTQSTQVKAEAKPSPQPAPKPAAPKTVESKPAPAPQPKPAPKPAPAPKKPAIGSNKIGINGNYKSYSNYGRASTDTLQAGIDSGLIVAGLNNFNGTDGATTYFGGHNPGIMNFMASSIRVGAVITVTDSSGNVFNYKMIDKVDVDEYGEGVLKSIGVSAIDAYMYGTGSESILIQFCNTNNNLMSFWYGVKI